MPSEAGIADCRVSKCDRKTCSTQWDPQQKMLDGRMWSVCNVRPQVCSVEQTGDAAVTIPLTGTTWFHKQFGARPFRHRWTVTISLNARDCGQTRASAHWCREMLVVESEPPVPKVWRGRTDSTPVCSFSVHWCQVQE